MSLAYSAFFDAARMRDGLVVASCGLYLAMVAKSPESQTTVYATLALYDDVSHSRRSKIRTVPVAFSASRELLMFVVGVVIGG